MPNSRHYRNIDLLKWTLINVQRVKQFSKVSPHRRLDIGIEENIYAKVTRIEINQFLDSFVVSVQTH
jgi:hypothetical protein